MRFQIRASCFAIALVLAVGGCNSSTQVGADGTGTSSPGGGGTSGAGDGVSGSGTSDGAAKLSFAPPVDFTAGTALWLVRAADLNNDGAPDLVVANGGSVPPVPLLPGISVLMNTTPAGSMTPSFSGPTNFIAGDINTLGVALGDLNGDGRPDIAVANYDAAGVLGGSISVLLNHTKDGAATPDFGAQQTFKVGSGPSVLAFADVNHDGKLDLVVGNSGSMGPQAVSVFINTTPVGADVITLAPLANFDGGNVSEGIDIGDIDHDGKPDIVLGNTQGGTVTVLLNRTPDGALTPVFVGPIQIPLSGATDIQVGDLNGDGLVDLVVGSALGGVSVAFNQTLQSADTPKFSPFTLYKVGNPLEVEGIALADFDRDGKLDIAASTPESASLVGTVLPGVSVLLNQTAKGAAQPKFSAPYVFNSGNAVSNGANSITAVDVNRDGWPDIVIANAGASGSTGGGVSILLNTSGQSSP